MGDGALSVIQSVGAANPAATESGFPNFYTTSLEYTLDRSTDPVQPYFTPSGGIGDAAVGDWIVCAFITLNTDTIGTPAGFDVLVNTTVGGYRFYIAVREVVDVGDLTDHWTFTFSGVKIIDSRRFDLYRGMTSLRATDNDTVNTSATVSAPSVTAFANDDLMTVLLSGSNGVGSNYSSITPTQDVEFDNSSSGSNESVFIGVRTPSAGATGTTSGTRTAAAVQLGAHLLWNTTAGGWTVGQVRWSAA